MIVGDFSVSRPSAPLAPADSDIIQPEFWAVPQDGDPFVIAEVGDFDIAGIAGSRGAVSIEVPTRTVIHDLLVANTVDADSDLEIEIRLFGGQARSLRGFLTSSDADEVAEGGSRRFNGVLMAQRMYETVLYPLPLAEDPKGETHFAAKNAGQIVLTLVQRAKARGALTDIDTSTFNTANDSNGVPWATNTTITLSPGSTYGELLEEFEELGLCEWEVTGFRELKLFVPGTRGTDRTVGQSGALAQGAFGTGAFGTSPFGGTSEVANVGLTVLHRGRDLVDAPRSHDVRDSVTTLLTAGKEGLYHSETDPTAQARRGRRIEGYASAGQIDNAAALIGFAQNKLATLSPGAMELSHGLVCNGAASGPVPFLDINLGDWIWSDTGRGAGPERLRVQQVSISRRGGELQAQAVVGTLSMSAIVALNRRLARLERGTTVVGTTEADPAEGGADTTPPSAPTGLVASSIAYQDTPTGETLAMITVGWEAVTTDARGDLSPKAQAAQLILDRIQSGAGVLEDWTWHGCPEIVATHNDALLAEYAIDDPDYDFPDDLPQVETWLQDYITEAEAAVSDPVVTDDVAGYAVRYAYVGIGQIGGLPSSDPFEGDVLAYYMATPDTGTTATSYTFGGVGAGRDIRVQVQAFDRSGNRSVWSNPLTFTTASDNTPPPATSAPVLSTWFRTLDVNWDGKTVDGIDMLTAAPDFDHVAVIVSQQASFTAPPMVGDPAAFDPNLTGPQWVSNMYGARTDNFAGLTIGPGWYAMLVAVDRAGNVSGSSAIAGPVTAERLVQIDIGPDAIGRQQIIDLEVVRAKIDDLAVNSQKVEEVQVGLLTAGTMTATVTNSGLFRTAATGNRIEFDSSGLRLFQGSTVIGRWQTTDASMLMTGVFQTGLTGERLMMFTDGTLRFYPVAGTNYSQISNFGNDVVWRGPLDANGRSGRFNVNILGAAINFSNEQEIPSNLRSEVIVVDRQIRFTAPTQIARVDGRMTAPDGGTRRFTWVTSNSSGVDIGASVLNYTARSLDSRPALTGLASGIVFGSDGAAITTGSSGTFGPIGASQFNTGSSREIKTDIERLTGSLGVVRAVTPVSYRYRPGYAPSQPRHVGLIIEEVEPAAPVLVHGRDRPARERSLDAMGVAATAWGATAELADMVDALRSRIEALESAA